MHFCGNQFHTPFLLVVWYFSPKGENIINDHSYPTVGANRNTVALFSTALLTWAIKPRC